MAVRFSFHPFVSVANGSPRLVPLSSTTITVFSRTLVWTAYSQIGDARLTVFLDPSGRSSSVRLRGREVPRKVTKGTQLKPLSRECEILKQPLRKSGTSHIQKVRRLQIRATTSSMDVSMKTDNVGGFEQDIKRPPFLTEGSYSPPSWASHLNPVPPSFSSLGLFPTPIHRWHLPGLPSGTDLWIKRDDLSGMQMSGNKVRKLEFLMADAMAQGADCVITIGGIQSNHCRATAVAARYLGLDAYLILRTSRTVVEEDPGLAGNLLVERLVGAHIDLVTKEEYVKYGSEALGNMLLKRLRAEGRKPYLIPVGGSNSLGTWGYIEGVREIEIQLRQGTADGASHFDVIVMACGSGGTTAGLALGSHLSTLKSRVHAYAVCDDEKYFYDFVQGLLDGCNAGVNSRDILEVKMAKGLGYAMSTAEELKVVKDVAERTGVILDPVYSGKAINGLLKDMNENPAYWQGRKVLFIHTGGLLGIYDKVDQLQPMVGRAQRVVFDFAP